MDNRESTIDFFPMDYSASIGQQDTSKMPAFSQNINGNINNSYSSGASTSFEDEPPLWEELGIDPELMRTKTLAILFQKSRLNPTLLNDADLGGPFVFCLMLGGALILNGRMHFGYIFGYSITGSLLIYVLLNLMTEQGIGAYQTMSVLGYSLPPMILLALLSRIFHPTTTIGLCIAATTIGFCTHSASYMFTRVLGAADEGGLFAYPIGLLYTCFALIVMF